MAEPLNALRAAIASQKVLFHEPWGEVVIKVRMALHCGEVETRDDDYFGQPLNHLGQIQRYIGEAYARTEAARCLVYHVARSIGPDRRNRIGSDAAKLFASTAAKEVADAAIQVLGGYGYCEEYKVERLYRDAKLIEIGGGTIESHQKNLTKDLTRIVCG